MPPRGRGGKFNKPGRGGGKKFSRDLQPLDKDGAQVSMWREAGEMPETSEEEEEDSSEEDEESSEDDAGPSSTELTREQRKELAKKKKADAIAKKNAKVAAPGDLPTDSEEESEDEGDLPANPNHTSKARNQARAVTGASGETDKPKAKENLSRREKEALAAQQAKERYQKLHAEGKTDEAKADLARLKLIKEQREAAAARKQAEKEEEDERKKENKERLDKEATKRAAAMGDAAKPKKKAVK